jgi:hypothetical protein
VSFLEHGRYEFFGGQAMGPWSPFYALWFTAFQKLLGVSGESVAIALAATSALAACIWSSLVLYLAGHGPDGPKTASRWLLAASIATIGLLLITTQYSPQANALQLLFVPLSAVLAVRLHMEDKPKRLALASLLFLLVAILMTLAHYTGLIYIPAAALLLLFNPHFRLSRLFPLAALFLGVGIFVCWQFVVPWFKLHTAYVPPKTPATTAFSWNMLTLLGRGWGKQTPAVYARQLLEGLGQFFLPHKMAWVGIPVVVAIGAWLLQHAVRTVLNYRLLCRAERGNVEARLDVPLACVTVYIFVSLASLYVAFNTRYVEDALLGRFLWIPVLAATTVLLVAGQQRSPRLLILAFLALAFFPGLRTAKYITRGVVQKQRLEEHVFTNNIVRPYYIISSVPADRAPGLGKIIVNPPDYPWINRNPTGGKREMPQPQR